MVVRHTCVCVCYLWECLQLALHFWLEICIYTVWSKAASVSQILHFISCEKLCALHSKSKYYTQDFLTLESCERLAVLNWHGVIPSKLMNRGWKYPLKYGGGVKVSSWKRENWEPCYGFLCMWHHEQGWPCFAHCLRSIGIFVWNPL